MKKRKESFVKKKSIAKAVLMIGLFGGMVMMPETVSPKIVEVATQDKLKKKRGSLKR